MNNDIIFDMGTHTYVARIETAKEGGYTAYFPSLPGCVTQGDTIEEIIAMAKDALAEYLTVLRDTGGSIPPEKSSLRGMRSKFTLPVSVALA